MSFFVSLFLYYKHFMFIAEKFTTCLVDIIAKIKDGNQR